MTTADINSPHFINSDGVVMCKTHSDNLETKMSTREKFYFAKETKNAVICNACAKSVGK